VKKTLFSLMALLLCLGLVGASFAYFSDQETSSGNTFTAGTLDLDSIGSFTWGNVAPGGVNTEPISLTNSGTIAAASVFLELDVVDSEPTADNDPETAAETVIGIDTYDISTQIQITAMTYTPAGEAAVDITGLYSDSNSNGWLDLDDLNAAGEVEINGSNPLGAGTTDVVSIQMTLRTDTGNEYQGDLSTVDELARITQD